MLQNLSTLRNVFGVDLFIKDTGIESIVNREQESVLRYLAPMAAQMRELILF